MSDPATISIKALRHFADGGDPFGDGPPLLTVDSDFFKGLVERLATAEAERDALRDAITALADEYEADAPKHAYVQKKFWLDVSADLRELLSEAGEPNE